MFSPPPSTPVMPTFMSFLEKFNSFRETRVERKKQECGAADLPHEVGLLGSSSETRPRDGTKGLLTRLVPLCNRPRLLEGAPPPQGGS